MKDCKTCRWYRDDLDVPVCTHEQAGTLGAPPVSARRKHGFCGPDGLMHDTSPCRVCGQDTRKRFPAFYRGSEREDLLALCSVECQAKWKEGHPRIRYGLMMPDCDATNGVDDRHE